LNDTESIRNVNLKIETQLLDKRETLEDVDGNHYEAFGRTPEDCRLPLQILTNEVPSFLDAGGADGTLNADGSTNEEAIPTPENEDDAFSECTDVSKGEFVSKGFAGELGVNASTLEVTIKVSKKDITIDNTITEDLSKLVWPCKDQREPCDVTKFTQSRGYDSTWLAGKKTEYDAFKTAAGFAQDEECIILAFWQNRIFPVCLSKPKDREDFIAVILKN